LNNNTGYIHALYDALECHAFLRRSGSMPNQSKGSLPSSLPAFSRP
jgi:hypothetical protein